MADNLKFLEREILNKVLNAGEDALNVDLTVGASAMLVDDAAFTPGTSSVQMIGAEFDDTGPDSVDEGDAGAVRMSANRNIYTTIRDAAGNERGVNVNSSNQLLVVEASASAIATDAAAIEVLLTAIESSADSLISANHTDLAALETTLTAIETDQAAIEVLLTAANVDHAANEVLLGTIDSDTDATKTALENMLYGNALVITAIHGGSGGTGTQTLGATYEALYIGVGGDVVVTMVGTGNFTFKNVASGQLLPIRITHVIHTNTTATNMIALKA